MDESIKRNDFDVLMDGLYYAKQTKDERYWMFLDKVIETLFKLANNIFDYGKFEFLSKEACVDVMVDRAFNEIKFYTPGKKAFNFFTIIMLNSMREQYQGYMKLSKGVA